MEKIVYGLLIKVWALLRWAQTVRGSMGKTHDDTATAAVMQWMLYSVPPTLPPPNPYIRCTLGCRRRKQGPSPCTEPFPSLVLNRAAHNKSRQWAMLNYSGTQKIAATDEAELHQEQWEFKKAKKLVVCVISPKSLSLYGCENCS